MRPRATRSLTECSAPVRVRCSRALTCVRTVQIARKRARAVFVRVLAVAQALLDALRASHRWLGLCGSSEWLKTLRRAGTPRSLARNRVSRSRTRLTRLQPTSADTQGPLPPWPSSERPHGSRSARSRRACSRRRPCSPMRARTPTSRAAMMGATTLRMRAETTVERTRRRKRFVCCAVAVLMEPQEEPEDVRRPARRFND